MKVVLIKTLFFVFVAVDVLMAQQKIDSILQLKGTERYYELNDFYGNNLKNTKTIAVINNIIDKKGDASDKLIKYFWLNVRPVIDSVGYNSTVISLYDDLVQKAEQIPNYYLAANYYISMGVIYNNLKNYNKSFENQLFCLDALSKDPEGKFFEQSWWLHIIANKFYLFQDYTKAVQLSKIASTIGLKYTPDGLWFEKINNNLVGMSYLKNAQYDSAFIWLQKTLKIATANKDTAWMGIATGNLGTMYYLQGNCTNAIKNYTIAIDWCKKTKIWDNVASFCNNLADCYLITGNDNPVLSLIDESKKANLKDVDNASYLSNQLKLYSIAETYYRKKGEIEVAIQFTDSVRKYESLHTNYFDINKKIKTEAEFAYNSKELQNKILVNQNKLQRQLLFFIIAVITLLTFILIFYLNSVRLKRKLNESNNKILNYELNTAKETIKSFTKHLLEKNALIESYSMEINTLKETVQNTSNSQIEILEQLKSSTILTNEDWLNFKVIFEKIYPNFFSDLKSNYQNLTQAEIRYLAFCKLDLTAKEMAMLLGVSDEAIRSLRFRLKKKITPSEMHKLALKTEE